MLRIMSPSPDFGGFPVFTKPRLVLAVFAVAGLLGACAPVSAQDKYLPPDTQMVMSFNLRNLMGSQAFQKHFKEQMEKTLRENAQAKKVFEAINMDPMRDLHTLTMAFSNVKVEAGNRRPEMEIFVVAKGKFDVQKIETAMQLFAADGKEKIAVTQMGNRKVFEIKGDDRTMYGAFVGTDTAVFTDAKDRLQSALERGEGRSGGGAMNKEFAKVLDRVDTRKSMWMAMVVPPSIKELAQNIPQGDVLDKVNGMVMGVNVTDGLTMDMNVYTTDKDAAVQIKDLFQLAKEALGPATLNIPDADLGAELAKVVSDMRISQNDNTASFSIELSSGTLDKIVKFTKSRAGGGD
jgi:hypothetical protein